MYLAPAAIAIHPWKGNHTLNQMKKGKCALNPNLLPQPDLMSFIIWNTRGANSAQFRRQCETMVKLHKPAMVVLFETKMTEHRRLGVALNYDSFIQSSAMGQSGGIVVLWKKELL